MTFFHVRATHMNPEIDGGVPYPTVYYDGPDEVLALAAMVTAATNYSGENVVKGNGKNRVLAVHMDIEHNVPPLRNSVFVCRACGNSGNDVWIANHIC